MTGLTALALGLGLGLRHAADADHVVVVSALVERERGLVRAARIAALWGAGHAATLIGAGTAFIIAGVRAPPVLETATELLVACMLIAFGGMHVLRHLRPATKESARKAPGTAARPLLIGMVHGLAGSAGIVVVALTTMGSRSSALVYLALFGIGSVGGMVLLTIVLSFALQWTSGLRSSARRSIGIVPGLLSFVLGLVLLSEVLCGTYA